MAKVYKDDVGTVIQIDCGTNLNGASAYAFKVMKPNTTTEETWTATLVDDDDDDTIQVTTDGSDIALDVAGQYKIQPHITGLSGWTGRGEMVYLDVYEHQT